MEKNFKVASRAGFVVAAVLLAAPVAAQAKGFEVLYAFKGGTDGFGPASQPIFDPSGMLYATTYGGGANDSGTVFKLAPDGTHTVLYSFKGGNDGAEPQGNLLIDKQGNLFGVTSFGGADAVGIVFELTPDGTETVLHTFVCCNDGAEPQSGLIRDKTGNLYGTTTFGGGANDAGTVFKLAPGGALTVLHAFGNANDGAYPYGGLFADKLGNLYGTTSAGGGVGNCPAGCGIVFRIAPDGTETVLHNFTPETGDAEEPLGTLIKDSSGNLYGTSFGGGQAYDGAIFKLAPDGTETVLYSFTDGNDGFQIEAGLRRDKAGNLYGTSYQGGTYGNGTVFKLAPDGAFSVLHTFTGGGFAGGSDGQWPMDALTKGADGTFYGTTFAGGTHGDGVVFRIKK